MTSSDHNAYKVDGPRYARPHPRFPDRQDTVRSVAELTELEAKDELRGAGVDESPHCYKRLTDVLAAHSNTLKVVHTLTPVGVAMAGGDDVDPYKD